MTSRSPRSRWTSALAGLALAAASLAATVATATPAAADTLTFPGSGFGQIPDGPAGCAQPGAPLEITFGVSGVVGRTQVAVTGLDGYHSRVGGLTATLVAPSGAQRVLFQRPGATSGSPYGDADVFDGPYSFADSEAGFDFAFIAVNTIGDVPDGTYRTSDVAGSPTQLSDAFGALTDVNGTWRLLVTDACGGDGGVGSISGASLVFTEGGCARKEAALAAAEKTLAAAQGASISAQTALTSAVVVAAVAGSAPSAAASAKAAADAALAKAKTKLAKAKKSGSAAKVKKARAKLKKAKAAQAAAAAALGSAQSAQAGAAAALSAAQAASAAAQTALAKAQSDRDAARAAVVACQA